ncbi:mucin-2 [Carassius carassius]|uniref:mucin-2 n=1 Tax=Carassius carassius TaxID=217509 RepID=UPI002868DC6B|nr:mucin-2 [Carassius carassius]
MTGITTTLTTKTSTGSSIMSPTFTTLKANTLTLTPGCNCHWSDWNDFGSPTAGPDGGEIVPIEKITDTYPTLCSALMEVQCRAKHYPEVPLSKLGQIVKCSKKDGLICLNKHQGLAQQCYDYEIRTFCCDENCRNITTSLLSTATTTVSSTSMHLQPSTTSVVQSSSTVTGISTDTSTTISTGRSSPTFSTSMPSTPVNTSTNLTSYTSASLSTTTSTMHSVSPSVSSTERFTEITTPRVQNSPTGTSIPTTPSTIITPSPVFSTSMTSPLTKTTLVQNSSSMTGITTTLTTKTSTDSSIMSPTSTTLKAVTLTLTPGCNCHWSDWNDFGSPTAGPDGGEIVPIEKIIDTYPTLCSALMEVQCRAKRYPEVPLSKLGQTVKCSKKDATSQHHHLAQLQQRHQQACTYHHHAYNTNYGIDKPYFLKYKHISKSSKNFHYLFCYTFRFFNKQIYTNYNTKSPEFPHCQHASTTTYNINKSYFPHKYKHISNYSNKFHIFFGNTFNFFNNKIYTRGYHTDSPEFPH